MSDRDLSRRRFLGVCASCAALTAGGALLPRPLARLAALAVPDARADTLAERIRVAPRARYWVASTSADCGACHAAGTWTPGAAHEHRRVTIRCLLCARQCTIADGERGACRARANHEGELRSLVYGRPIAAHVDPIEKKPFYHFLPGRSAYSIATAGCPLRCRFCQNWEISQARPEDDDGPFVTPTEIVGAAEAADAPVIAFTYNEPTVFTEYLCDIARVARPRGRRSVLVSCGFMNQAPLTEMCGVLDAIKIDLKGFSPGFYRQVCDAEIDPVLRSIRQVAASGVHLEIVNLVVPTLNDSVDMLTDLAKWLVGEAGPDVPVHFTRFHPDYQLTNLPPTPIRTLETAREIAMQHGIRFAYVGNVPGHPGNHTYCPGCGKVVIERDGFLVSAIHLVEGRCAYCGRPIPGVWS